MEKDKLVTFSITYKGVNYEIVSPLLGMYNVYNVTLAFAICLLSGLDSDFIINEIKNLKPVLGRRESLNFGQDFELILDYAHTFNGIKNILESVQNYKKIITVTGAAGGREKEKRSKIGKIVLEKSDVVIFTMDDPRYEDVDSIIDDLIGDYKGNNYERIIDRLSAIKRAVDIANSNDILVIMGKGRDNYMAILDKKIPYSDYEVLKDILSNK